MKKKNKLNYNSIRKIFLQKEILLFLQKEFSQNYKSDFSELLQNKINEVKKSFIYF